MKNFAKHELIMTIIILFCLITVFCLGDYYERRGVIIGVIATIAYMWWYMSGGDR
ncbi:unnamed protein product [marine sediment metagenome]|uniref:Uncharacterized protein n=1 Tax=marine sediment metagenome TaxID=412755 RepID=X0XF86_9ZZZZ